MSLKERIGKRTVPYNLCVCISIVLALAGVVLYAAYVNAGGTNLVTLYLAAAAGIAAHLVLFFYNGVLKDIIGAVPPILFTVAAMAQLRSDYGNLVDKFNNIRMYGDRDLAWMNIAIAVIFLAAAIISAVACFIKREKEQA